MPLAKSFLDKALPSQANRILAAPVLLDRVRQIAVH